MTTPDYWPNAYRELAAELHAVIAERDSLRRTIEAVDDALARNADMHTTLIYRDVRAALEGGTGD